MADTVASNEKIAWEYRSMAVAEPLFEPDVAAAYAAAQGMHREGSARVARRLASLGALASTTTPEEATAAIELLTGVETYETLLGRGWSLDRAERWIVAALRRLLLPG